MSSDGFTEEQKQYLQGFVSGVEARRSANGLPGLLAGVRDGAGVSGESEPSGPDAIHIRAQNKFLAEGKKLANEEDAKREAHPFDIYDQMRAKADAGEFPKGVDIFRWKFHGLFYVAPAQDCFMCRLRIPNGILSSHQFRGIADLAEKYGGGYSHVTTRNNLQVRDIEAKDGLHFIEGLQDLGLTARGSGADNIRNITGAPTAGIDAAELYDTRALAKEMQYAILNKREMYGLPRKFNIAFDGGGRIAVLEDTNDIGFQAVRVKDGAPVEPGIWFRLTLGGITGHEDFARDTGVIVKPEECIEISEAIVKVFSESGDRTNRNKARMKYVLDDWGFDKYLAEMEKVLGRELTRIDAEHLEERTPAIPHAHIGVHEQKQEGLYYIGVVMPVGKMTCDQMRALSDIASDLGSSTIRLTVWQNLLISDIPADKLDEAKARIEATGLDWKTTSVRAGLIACTGNAGCRFSASDTKRHATEIADYVETKVELDQPVNIHMTGCHHSCAQHYIGDIGLIACKVDPSGGEDDDAEEVEGYHIFVGGGYAENAKIGRELMRDVTADEAPKAVERILKAYLAGRLSESETFQQFALRHDIEDLKKQVEAV